MKIILEFPGDTAEEAMAGVRAFAEAWANVYANAALPAEQAPAGRPPETRYFHHPESDSWFTTHDGSRPDDGLVEEVTKAKFMDHAAKEAAERVQRGNDFLDEVSALERREDLKPEPKPAQTKPPNGVRRKQVEAAFRTMIDKYKVGPDDGPATRAGREVLKQLGVANVPAIPEEKLAACLALLNISDCYPTAEAFIERLQSHEAAV